MKKLITVAITILAIAIFTATISHAADKLIDLKVSKVISKIDKNGDDYKIIIVKVPKTLNGQRYMSSMAVMAFSDTIDLVDAVVVGEQLKAIVNLRQYQGRTSATLLAMIE